MYTWSLALIILLAGCMPIDHSDKCEEARVEIEVYTDAMNKPGCRNNDNAWYLVRAKTNEIKYCPSGNERLH